MADTSVSHTNLISFQLQIFPLCKLYVQHYVPSVLKIERGEYGPGVSGCSDPVHGPVLSDISQRPLWQTLRLPCDVHTLTRPWALAVDTYTPGITRTQRACPPLPNRRIVCVFLMETLTSFLLAS